MQYPIIMDIRSRPRLLSSITGTKGSLSTGLAVSVLPQHIPCSRPLCLCCADLQQVNVSLRLLTRPVESKLPDLYQELGQDYDERILPSIGNEVLKAVVVF